MDNKGITYIESSVLADLAPINEPDKIYERVMGDIGGVSGVFTEKIEKHYLNYDYYAGRQWTDEEKQAHAEQFRESYVFNEMQAKIDHLEGTQVQTRLDARCVPREKGDSAKAEMLTYIIKWVEQTNSIEYVETEVFKDAVIGAAGAAVVRWEMEDLVSGYPCVEKVPINELYWDVNAKKRDLSDARWMARVTYLSRMEAKEMFPQNRKAIDGACIVDSTQYNGRFHNVMSDHQQEAIQATTTYSTAKGREIVEIVEHYEKFQKYKYVVIDDIAQRIERFDRKTAAKAYYEGVKSEYAKQGQSLIQPNGTPKILFASTNQSMLRQTIVVGDKVISHVDVDLPDYPFVVNFAYWQDGDYWSFAENLIGPQRFTNRFISQWDYQLGVSAKNPTTVVEQLLRSDWTLTEVQEELSRTGPIVPVKSHEAIRMHQSPPLNPEFFQGINFARMFMQDFAGGRNALGLQENAAESGRAVMARAEQGGMSRLPLFDGLRFWRENITLRLVWYIKNYMPSRQIMKIIGLSDDVRFVDPDDGVIDSLKEIKVDIIIDEVVKTESIRERNFQQMKELFSVIPGLPPEVVSNIMLGYSNIPESKKREIKQQLEFYQKYIEEKAQMEKQNKLTSEVLDSLKKKEIKESLTMADELKDVEQQIRKEEKNVKTALDDIEKAEMQIRETEATSPMEKMSMQDKYGDRNEIKSGLTANIIGTITK